MAIHLSGLPEGAPEGADEPPIPLLGLAPGGVDRAARVAPDAGALLPHRFTLTCAVRSPGKPSAVCSLLHCPSGHPDLALASTLLCGVPTFLDQPAHTDGPRPPGRLTVGDRVAATSVGDAGQASSYVSS